MLNDALYAEKRVSSWNDLLEHYNGLQQNADRTGKRWIFRGQRSHSGRHFSTSLERAAQAFGIVLDKLPEVEAWLVKEFTRRLHHYIPDPQLSVEGLEWLALMQHYGAPTRLHDWTYSFFVAAYFAVERAEGGSCEIWALNSDYFTADKVLNADDYSRLLAGVRPMKENPIYRYDDESIALQDAIIEHLWSMPTPLVFPANPFKLNDRSTVQQGVFLFPGDTSKPLEDNLTVEPYRGECKENLVRLRIVGGPDVQKDVLKHLHRMNIDRATLFPGLGGFAESLRTRLAFLPEVTA